MPTPTRRGGIRLLAALVATALALTLALPTASAAPKTKLISQSTSGGQTASASYRSDIGAHGGAVVLETNGNLLGTDYNGLYDIYRRSVGAKQTDFVSRARNGDLSNGGSTSPALSASGRYAAFVSHATNLTAADPQGHGQVYRRDLAKGKTSLVSKGADGVADSLARTPDISATGRYVVFATGAANLTTKDTHGREQVYLRDMKLKRVFLVSKSAKGVASDSDCYFPAVSDDGRFITFASLASNLSKTDERGHRQIYLRDRKLGKTYMISKHPTKGKAGDAWSNAPDISGNGRYVTFQSDAANLIKWGVDSNGTTDVYKYDRVRKTLRRVSVDRRGRQLMGASYQSSVSGNGRVVVFSSDAPNVVPGVATGHTQVYRRGLLPTSIKLVSRTNDGVPANGVSGYPSVSDDGRYVAYLSEATNLTKRVDANGSIQDVFRTGPF